MPEVQAQVRHGIHRPGARPVRRTCAANSEEAPQPDGVWSTWYSTCSDLLGWEDAWNNVIGSIGSDVPWFTGTGTGRVGTTVGSGNSDLYVHSDGIHPTQAGHAYAGHRFATLLRAALRRRNRSPGATRP